jgi:hypothetical protein
LNDDYYLNLQHQFTNIHWFFIEPYKLAALFALSDLWLLLTWFWCRLKDVNEPLSQLITQVLFGLPKGVSHFMYEPLDHFFNYSLPKHLMYWKILTILYVYA